jgi:P-type Cu2+ transporter
MRELASCFQCQCVMAGPGISLEIGDALRIVCSRECELAAQQIGDLGLARFYDYRERFKAGALPSVDVEQPRGREPGRDDERRLALAAGVQHVRGVSRLSVRVPDIRCAACTWLIESSLRKRPDVLRCMTSLADRIVTVEYRQADPLTFVTFIEGLGFTVLPDRSAPVRSALERERKSLLARLGVAGIGMMQVMMYALTTYVAGDAGIELRRRWCCSVQCLSTVAHGVICAIFPQAWMFRFQSPFSPLLACR